ncbi:hypothetical protein V6N11_031737 [Hibiscus sabdariffa]|uniref:Uncharacterized protein n=1 Tax=Hibiscus sabdariffa TaxID=183260 RepID=A0ABR2SZA6_9ROSI
MKKFTNLTSGNSPAPTGLNFNTVKTFGSDKSPKDLPLQETHTSPLLGFNELRRGKGESKPAVQKKKQKLCDKKYSTQPRSLEPNHSPRRLRLRTNDRRPDLEGCPAPRVRYTSNKSTLKGGKPGGKG